MWLRKNRALGARTKSLGAGVLLLVSSVVFGFASPASATSLMFTSYIDEGQTANTNLTIGTEFTVGSISLQVLALGVYDGGGIGLGVSHDVGIWLASDQSLVGSATVAMGGGTLVEDWRFVDVAAFTLQADTTYRIAAHVGETADFDPIGGSFSLGPTIASVTLGSFQAAGTSLSFPSTDINNARVFGNAEVEPVPEPATLLLLGSGLLGLAGWRWKQAHLTKS